MRFNEFHKVAAQPTARTAATTRLRLRRSPSSHGSRSAFTLIEVMIVVVIIGLLAGLVTFSTRGIIERANRKKAFADITTLYNACEQYYLATGRHPDNHEGLQALVPEFIKVLPKDPWGNPYVYVEPGKSGPGSFDIISYGKDGREGGTGADADITSNDIEVKELPKK
jgi:general secretion pathway protein G